MTHAMPVMTHVIHPSERPGSLVPPGADPILKASAIEKYFGTNHVLRGASMTVWPHETVAILGRSGSGKSTFLRCINFLEEPSAGVVDLDGFAVEAKPFGGRTRDHREKIRQLRIHASMVFQEFNLFPHLSVLGNLIEAPIHVKGQSRQEATELAEGYLEKVGLVDKRNEYPSRLSGGQRQRVAIARALTMEPKVLLFDEPTSALDPSLVGEVIAVMESLAHEGRTMIVVTHEMQFAREAADRVYFMELGRFIEVGPPDEVIDNPQDPLTRQFLSRFLGAAHVHEGGEIHEPEGAGAVHLHAEGGAAHDPHADHADHDHHDHDDQDHGHDEAHHPHDH